MLLDTEEERFNNKFNRIAKAGAIRLEGIDHNKGVKDVIQDLSKFKKKRIDYRYNHYGIKPIHKEVATKEQSFKKDQYALELFPFKKTATEAKDDGNL